MTKGRIPRHVAIIMDGNGRWATRRGLRAWRPQRRDALRAQRRGAAARGYGR